MGRDRTWLLLLPALSLLALLFLAPLVWFLARTLFIETAPADVPELFVDVLTARPMQIAALTTLWVSALVTLATLVVGYPIAFYLANRRGWRAALVVFCVIVPYFTSVFVRTYALIVVLGRSGLINELLGASGLIGAPLTLLYNTFGIVVGMTYVLLPYMVLTLYATMKAIDPSLLRAGRALGASPSICSGASISRCQSRDRVGLAHRPHPGARLLHHASPDGRARRRHGRDAHRAGGRDPDRLAERGRDVRGAARRDPDPLRSLRPRDGSASHDGA
ncbi:ABC transporter permease [Methylobacterium oryzae CBMB20]